MKTTSKPIIYVLTCVSSIIMVLPGCNYPTKEAMKLSMKPHAEDGSVSGSYHDPGDSGDQTVHFTVSNNGLATFHLAGASDSETLTVLLSDNRTASLNWNGATLDGQGALTGEEQAVFDNLMNSDLAHSLEMIPLDVGCLGDENIKAEQVAALLVPLQMRYKYLVSDRAAETRRLIALSECNYGSFEEFTEEKVSVIMFSASVSVPVVFGFFPFDAEGAVEPQMSLGNGLQTACLASSTFTTDGRLSPYNLFGTSLKTKSGLVSNAEGPCNAKCRGACGADCPPSNCNQSTELRCEKDEAGRNTGMEIRYLIYDCGMHQGCIDHDQCYDQCNEKYGCGWLAAFCRHAHTLDLTTLMTSPLYCDQKAIGIYGLVDAGLWSQGYGPQPLRETFEYLDDTYKAQQALDKCPLGESDSSQPEDSEKQPAETSLEESELDICSLLPVDASQVINPSKRACVAEIDSLVGCGSCGSTISLTQMESVERAQQAAVDGNCGNPKFDAKGASILGDAGFTCTDISGEAYREGVSQRYFLISFSYGPYVAQISTGYPGQEDLVIGLGQGIIERIDLQNK